MSLVDKHIFAIYTPDFWDKNYTINSILKVVDPDIVHRLIKVLRTQIGEKFIFFDTVQYGIVEVVAITKKDFSVKIISLEKNSASLPKITFLLPLLKKEALEEAVYSLAEIGISEIQLVVTQKSRQKLLHEKEFARLESIVIAAAEQSKNYLLSKIHTPVALGDLELNSDYFKIVFDPQGESFFDIRLKYSQEQICLLVGPEGGFTQEELQNIEEKSFKKCRLTPTILRAVQAVAIGAALFKIN